MPTAATHLAEQKTADATSAASGPGYAKTQAAREPLLVAQIYAVKGAKAYPTGDAAVIVQIGDPTCAPHKHGIRASRELWTALINDLFAADPVLAARCRR